MYVANSATNANNKGDGIFVFGADLSDTFGQGRVPLNGGITNFATGGASSPYRLKVGQDDDNLYVPDWSDPSGNLYVTDPNVSPSSVTSYALKPLTGTAATPVGANNNHGSVAAVEVTGSLAAGNLKIFTIDEDYQTDPTASGVFEGNSLWEYDVNSGPLPWNDPPVLKLLTPTINFVSQTMDLSYSPATGYFYASDLRSSGNEAGVFVADSAGNLLFNSRTESVAEGAAADFLANLQGVTVSRDGKYMAVLANNNVVTIVPLTNGIPNLPARFQYTGFGATTSGRGIAFDAADNLYVVSSGLGILQSLSLGFTATNTTSSDGLFTVSTPSTLVQATLLDPGTTVTNTLYQSDPSIVATINLVRTNDDFSGPLGVNFAVSGTATRGTQVAGDYSIRTNGVVVTNATTVFIPTGSSNLLVQIVANNDTTPELTETINFSVSGGPYSVLGTSSMALSIVDDDSQMIDVSAVTFSQAFEGNTNDFIRFSLTRRGDTNAPSFPVDLKYSGTATSNVDYFAVQQVTFDPGVTKVNVDIHPMDDLLVEGSETVGLSINSGTGYLVGTNNPATAFGTIVDDDQPAAPVLFSDDFNLDTSANWTQLFAAQTNENYDATVAFAFDYSSLGVTPAPHSTNDTLGLMVTVNKDFDAAAAGINLYPIGQNFSNNFALRFDMYLMQNGSAGTTEYAMFGINHSGTKTNWFRNSGAGVVIPNWTYDGIWAYVEADGAALGDYVLNSAPTVNSGGVIGPTALASRLASTLTDVFHQPPWSSGSGPGAPGNAYNTTTPSWAEVELSQLNNAITLKINNTVIMNYSNATAFTNGNIMLGYDDAYDSIGTGGGGLVIYDNVRVVGLPDVGLRITNISLSGTNAVIDFTWPLNDPASSFKLQSATTVTGPYTDDTNAATTYSVVEPGASYRIVTPRTGAIRFYRIRHL